MFATSKTGTAYVGWIANTSKTNGATRAAHLCEVKPGTTSCSGWGTGGRGPGPRLFRRVPRAGAEPSGTVDLVWFYNDETGGGHIGLASTSSTGKLQPWVNEGSAPNNGQLLDAEIAPDGKVWTVAGPSERQRHAGRPGKGAAAMNVTTLYPVGYAELAFTGTTPVITTQQGGSVTGPAGYTFESKGNWSARPQRRQHVVRRSSSSALHGHEHGP